MNSRKITALLLSSAMALSVLTGCGGVNKNNLRLFTKRIIIN